MIGILRQILIALDSVIYGVLEQIFQLIINLANFNLFSGNVLRNFSTRIYLILGLVMVFKLMISFIQILIDPDKMNDKEQGVGNLLLRVVISMVLIVLVPSIFETAKNLQNYVLPVIPKVVLGISADVDNTNVDSTATTTAKNIETEDGDVMVSTGRLMAYYSFLPFFYYSDEQCNNGHLLGTTEDGTAVTIRSVADAAAEVNDKNCPQSSNGYTYNYRMLLSTVVGAYLVYVLVTVALKIAIRTIKFGICELIAPIPIASYIDPKTSKKAFDNWVSTSVKVYLDLFTRLIVVYFIVFIFSILFDGGRVQQIFGKYGFFQGTMVLLFIIIGLLQFAKEMPKFISGMLGISDGFSDIGDMFKGQGFRALGSAAGALAAPVGTAIGNYRYARQNGDSKKRALFGAAAGGVASLGRGAAAVANGKGFNDSFWNNIATTTGNAHRRVNERAIKRQLKKEYEEGNATVDKNIADIENQYARDSVNLPNRRGRLDSLATRISNRISALQANNTALQSNLSSAETRLNNSRTRLSAAQGAQASAQTAFNNAQTNLNSARSELRLAETEYRNASQFGTDMDAQTAETKYRIAREQFNRAHNNFNDTQLNLNNANSELAMANSELTTNENDYNTIKASYDQNQHDLSVLNDRYNQINTELASVDNQISTLDSRRDDAIKKAESNRPREINPERDAILASLNRAQGLSSVTGSTYVDVSQQLSSVRSSYYTGEAMKKLKEEGSKVTKRFDLTDGHGHTINATYSEVAAALTDLQSGRTPMINGVEFPGSAADLQEMYSLVEKNAAIEYINMVDRGEIKNTTIEEGNKQVAAMLSGLQIDDATRKELQGLFDKDKGKFYKALSDYAKQLETHGKRLQAYERAKKEGNS